ncbi:hypothetical protein [Pedobacter ginsengisoli]|uniref:hypothetical protein n=1 Tax=Pedobacter ginsengisoli TaxID=363852 RepID=UPI00254BC6E1|nr:hypothetical protein [Pedobacter ginsengisoli]
MKRILVLIIVLLTAIITMAYLYFTGLKADKKNNDNALYAAAAGSAFIFAFQNEKSILDILSSQKLLKEIIGDKKSEQLRILHQYLLNKPAINAFADKQNIYVSLYPGAGRDIDFLYSTQLSARSGQVQLMNALKSAGISASTDQGLSKLILDSTVFYFALKDNLLLISSTVNPVQKGLSAIPGKDGKFTEYIESTSKLSKTSLAEIYINYSNLPKLLQAAMPGNLNGELSVLNHQNAFASLVYNYSAKKILFNGNTQINDPASYYQLFVGSPAQKVTINTILPQNTANYTIYTIADYKNWRKSLISWFGSKKESEKINKIINHINAKYHLDPEQTFPKYFKNQFLTFQLSTTEKIGALELTNGDKLKQLLLDLSSNYSDDIKAFYEPDLLYSYFGEPFKKFRKPYYTIIDNYMVFANNASTVQSFLNSYKGNQLLINNTDYINSVGQLPNISGITFFINFKNSADLLLKNVYLPYYRHITGEKGLRDYSSFIYQLSAEQGKFQTNILLNKKEEALKRDSLEIDTDSLTITP